MAEPFLSNAVENVQEGFGSESVNAIVLRRVRLEAVSFYRAGATEAAPDVRHLPGRGEFFRTPTPNDERGIRFEVEKMVEYVKQFSGDRDVVVLAKRIAELCEPKDKLCEMTALFYWTKNHYRYVNDPVEKEMLTTPPRMVEDILAPPEVIREILGEDLIRQMHGFGVGKSILKRDRELRAESCFKDGRHCPRASEDCDSGAVFLATLFAAVGIVPRFRFGGTKAGERCNYYHVWTQGQGPGGEWIDFDVTEVSSKPGWFWPHFDCFGRASIWPGQE